MLKDTFATAITCIDGRVQRPVTDWIKLHVNVDHVDLITEPGPDKVFSAGPIELVQDMMRKVSFSVRHHFSKVVVLSGHDTCAANGVSREEHFEQILKGVERIQDFRLNVRIIGLWIGEFGSVEVVYDSQPVERKPSYL